MVDGGVDRYAGPGGECGRSGEANGSNGGGDDLTSAWGGGREYGRLDVRAEGDDPADASAKEDGDVRAWEDGHMTSARLEKVATSTRGRASRQEHLWGKTTRRPPSEPRRAAIARVGPTGA